MTRKQLEDFLSVITEIRRRNCVIPEQIFDLLKEAGVSADPRDMAEALSRVEF